MSVVLDCESVGSKAHGFVFVRRADKANNSALAYAARGGHAQIFKWILSHYLSGSTAQDLAEEAKEDDVRRAFTVASEHGQVRCLTAALRFHMSEPHWIVCSQTEIVDLLLSNYGEAIQPGSGAAASAESAAAGDSMESKAGDESKRAVRCWINIEVALMVTCAVQLLARQEQKRATVFLHAQQDMVLKLLFHPPSLQRYVEECLFRAVAENNEGVLDQCLQATQTYRLAIDLNNPADGKDGGPGTSCDPTPPSLRIG